ncbi:MAG: 6-phospho-3-hexuloisomerase [Anaerolineae bacterium]
MSFHPAMTDFHRLTESVLDELGAVLRAINTNEVDMLTHRLQEAPRIFVVGKGRTGLQLRAFAMRLMHLGLVVHVVDDVTTPALKAGDLLLIGSGSGRTPALLRYATRAHELGAQVALLTAEQGAPLAAKADSLVVIASAVRTPDGTRPSISTSVLFPGSIFEHALGLLLDMIVQRLLADLGITADEALTRHANLE